VRYDPRVKSLAFVVSFASLFAGLACASGMPAWVDDEGIPFIPDEAAPERYRPALPDRDSECDRLWRAYLDHQVCLGPYHVQGGGVRAAGFAACGPAVREPSAQCGPPPRQ
jgi:hypothetical protein